MKRIVTACRRWWDRVRLSKLERERLRLWEERMRQILVYGKHACDEPIGDDGFYTLDPGEADRAFSNSMSARYRRAASEEPDTKEEP